MGAREETQGWEGPGWGRGGESVSTLDKPTLDKSEKSENPDEVQKMSVNCPKLGKLNRQLSQAAVQLPCLSWKRQLIMGAESSWLAHSMKALPDSNRQGLMSPSFLFLSCDPERGTDFSMSRQAFQPQASAQPVHRTEHFPIFITRLMCLHGVMNDGNNNKSMMKEKKEKKGRKRRTIIYWEISIGLCLTYIVPISESC